MLLGVCLWAEVVRKPKSRIGVRDSELPPPSHSQHEGSLWQRVPAAMPVS